MPKARIILAEDHELVAEGILRIVGDEFDIVETVGDGIALLERCGVVRPDIVLTDMAMPKLNGLDALTQIKQKYPRTSVIVLTGSADVNLATESFRAGASGYVLKHAAATELITALREVWQGRTFVTPRIAQDVLQRLMQPQSAMDDGEPELTSRERQVLQLIAEGNSSKEAAAVLEISARTVEFHKRNVMKKTGLGSAAELARYASKIGLVADPS